MDGVENSNVFESADLLGMEQSPAKKARTGGNAEFRLEHFKAKYDQTWDYPGIAESMFNGPKYLVMLEDLSGNTHVHFQGYTDLAERTIQNKITELGSTHYEKQMDPKKRPVKHAKRAIDEKGFQYIMKETRDDRKILAMKGFTPEELDELHENSKAHVEKMKMSVYEYVQTHPELKTHDFYDEKTLFRNVCIDVYKFLRADDRQPGRHTTKDIAKGLAAHESCPESFIGWLFENNKF